MYLRATPRRNKDGSTVRYLQLAYNVWDPLAKRSRAQVLYNFGREDAASRAAIERLVASLSRHGRTLVQDALERARELLATHEVKPLPDEVDRHLDEVVAAHRRLALQTA
jgi:hypothetical protein